MRTASKLHCLLLLPPLPQKMRKLLLLLPKNQRLPLPVFLLLQLFDQQRLLLLLHRMLLRWSLSWLLLPLLLFVLLRSMWPVETYLHFAQLQKNDMSASFLGGSL